MRAAELETVSSHNFFLRPPVAMGQNGKRAPFVGPGFQGFRPSRNNTKKGTGVWSAVGPLGEAVKLKSVL